MQNQGPLIWKKEHPVPEDLCGHAEDYFWIRGGNFNRPLLVRANNGVNSKVENGERRYWADLNFSFYTESYPDHIWSGDLRRWPGLGDLEWAGPVQRPEGA